MLAMILRCIACLVFLASIAHAQSVPKERPRARPPSALTGWADWEKGAELLKRIQVPPAPVRSAEEEMKTFKLAPGYRLELVACEPMVQCPIFFEFDPDGRIWVTEYQGYMRDLKGGGEGDPICRLVVLEDTDEDGRADKQTVYLDGLVMPRSFAFVKGGILLQEPPKLWFCEDSDGDLKCDRRRQVGTMGVAGNPQHTANGLRYGIDNWLHCADWPKKYQWKDGELLEADTIHRGQFGVSFDDKGRFISCYENSALHMDLIPAEYLMRNPNLVKLAQHSPRGAFGVNVNIAKDAQEVFPIRPTPAVTLGALELRDDGRLRTYTIVSGTCFYDGDQFPDDARGNVFIPESGGHLIGRLKLTDGIEPVASRFYPPEQEFLASTDERFRPVNARTGPDGCLYIADMYHGIIEHIIFMVPWLTQQIKERKLDEGNDMGRIWRVVHEAKPVNRKRPALSMATSAALVENLGSTNGWHRMTAQRLLVERGRTEGGSPSVASGYTKFEGGSPLVQTALLHQLLLLGEQKSDESMIERAEMLKQNCGHLFRVAAASGLHGLEIHFLEMTQRFAGSDNERELLKLIARTLAVGGDGEALSQLFVFIERAAQWQREALLAGVLYRAAAGRPIALAKEPPLFSKLDAREDEFSKEKLPALRRLFTWPGAKSLEPVVSRASALSADDQKLIAAGEQHYTATCALCHQPNGTGVPGAFPPLAGSEWVTGDVERLVRIALHGLYGKIEVNGQPWNLVMPGHALSPLLDDERLAAALSYTRNAWGNQAATLSAKIVATIRAKHEGRMMPWTADELAGIVAKPEPDLVIKPDANGDIVLPASKATTYGQKLAYRPALDVLAPWTVADDSAEWMFEITNAGDYEVLVLLAADDDSAGDQYVIESPTSKTTGTVRSTGGYERHVEQRAGKLLLKAGTQRLLMRPSGPLKRELADVRALRLKRAAPPGER